MKKSHLFLAAAAALAISPAFAGPFAERDRAADPPEAGAAIEAAADMWNDQAGGPCINPDGKLDDSTVCDPAPPECAWWNIVCRFSDR